MNQKLIVIAFSCLIFLLSSTNALFFHIRETEKKCFIEEVATDTLLTGNYKVERWDRNSNSFVDTSEGLGMHVDVKDPNGNLVLSRTYSSEGRFTLTTHESGEHTICIHSNSSAWFGGNQLRVHLQINVGDHATNYKEVAQKEKLSDLQLKIRQLIDQVEMITKEQDYQRFREERFRNMSDSTSRRVFWWSLVQISVLLLTGFWQMRHLRGFFHAKKLV